MALPKFLTGVNCGWFSGRYGKDMGCNQFSGNELWHYPHDAPVSFDFTSPDPNPPAPLLSQQPALADQYFQLVQGVDVARVWVFEQLEGLRFDASKKVIGVDAELLTNLHMVLDSASARGIKVYLCLFDAWAVKHQPSPSLPPARLPHYNTWNATIRSVMKSIVEQPGDFVANALDPLLDEVAGHPALYAIDVMNEPEGMINDTPVVSDAKMRGYVQACCQAIQPRAPASVGCQHASTAKRYSNLPVSFCDFHSYSTSASLDAYRSSSYSGKPCMVGECGYPVSGSNTAARGASEVPVAQSYVNRALEKGYSACLVWDRDFTSDANKASIAQWLGQFAQANNQVRPEAPPPTGFAALIAAILRLFGLGP